MEDGPSVEEDTPGEVEVEYHEVDLIVPEHKIKQFPV